MTDEEIKKQKKETLIAFYNQSLFDKKRKLKTAVFLDTFLNLFSTILSIVVVVLALIVLVITIDAKNNLTEAQAEIILGFTFFKELGITSVELAVNLAIVTSAFIILNFALNIHIQFYMINAKFRKWRSLSRELSYYLAHLKFDPNYQTETFVKDAQQSIDYFSKRESMNFKTFVRKWFFREL